MSVQTKLSTSDKHRLKITRIQQEGLLYVAHYPTQRVTVGVHYVFGHNAARVFVALAGPTETKFRKKVGEYFVRQHFDAWKCRAVNAAGIPYLVHENERQQLDIHTVISERIANEVGVPDWY